MENSEIFGTPPASPAAEQAVQGEIKRSHMKPSTIAVEHATGCDERSSKISNENALGNQDCKHKVTTSSDSAPEKRPKTFVPMCLEDKFSTTASDKSLQTVTCQKETQSKNIAIYDKGVQTDEFSSDEESYEEVSYHKYCTTMHFNNSICRNHSIASNAALSLIACAATMSTSAVPMSAKSATLKISRPHIVIAAAALNEDNFQTLQSRPRRSLKKPRTWKSHTIYSTTTKKRQRIARIAA